MKRFSVDFKLDGFNPSTTFLEDESVDSMQTDCRPLSLRFDCTVPILSLNSVPFRREWRITLVPTGKASVAVGGEVVVSLIVSFKWMSTEEGSKTLLQMEKKDEVHTTGNDGKIEKDFFFFKLLEGKTFLRCSLAGQCMHYNVCCVRVSRLTNGLMCVRLPYACSTPSRSAHIQCSRDG